MADFRAIFGEDDSETPLCNQSEKVLQRTFGSPIGVIGH
jgi:hypothetical protein